MNGIPEIPSADLGDTFGDAKCLSKNGAGIVLVRVFWGVASWKSAMGTSKSDCADQSQKASNLRSSAQLHPQPRKPPWLPSQCTRLIDRFRKPWWFRFMARREVRQIVLCAIDSVICCTNRYHISLLNVSIDRLKHDEIFEVRTTSLIFLPELIGVLSTLWQICALRPKLLSSSSSSSYFFPFSATLWLQPAVARCVVRV